MLTLYGSTTSPFVRRLRIWLAHTEHTFINLHIFEAGDREILAKRNPTLKIPMLQDEQEVIFDSRQIYRYLNDKFAYPSLSWEQENHLTLIDNANDSLVQLLMLQRSDIDTQGEQLYFRVQRERVEAILAELNQLCEQGYFSDWHYPSICLYCLLDWIAFRNMHELGSFSALLSMLEDNHNRIEVTATDPRQ